MKWLVGIDEAGRGPLAGPVAVGLVKLPVDFDWSQIEGVNDSKKLSEKKREIIFYRAKELEKQGLIQCSVKLVSAASIDTKGISAAIKRAILAGCEELKLTPDNCSIKLDGSLKAPGEFVQETIIQGDGKELVIGLASVLAKVTRDDYMKQVAKKYPEYGLATHKGYGTKAHREAIAKFGFTPIHRKSFCRGITLLR